MKRFINIFFLTLCIFLITSISTTLAAESSKFYLDAQSQCRVNCGGDVSNAFHNFKVAIETMKQHTATNYPLILYVKEGDYFGKNNKGIHIDFNIEIISLGFAVSTVIDCQDAGYGFKITQSKTFYMSGFTITRCNGGTGGAFSISNEMSSFDNMVFHANAAHLGAAIYSMQTELNIGNTFFTSNTGGNAVYVKGGVSSFDQVQFKVNTNDLYCDGEATIETTYSTLGSICNECRILDANSENICGKSKNTDPCNSDGVCQSWIEHSLNCPTDCSDTGATCNYDGVCDTTFENQYFCTDCKRPENPGWKLKVSDGRLTYPFLSSDLNYEAGSLFKFVQYPEVHNLMAKRYLPVYAVLLSQVKPAKDGYYYFKLESRNVNPLVYVKGKILFNSFFPENVPSISSERKMLMKKDVPVNIDIGFTSFSNQERDFSLRWRHESEADFTSIPGYFKEIQDYSCGDGICNEDNPLNCLLDCHSQIEKICPGQSPPAKLQDVYSNVHDTIGTLLSNQYIFSLPGINYISHGIDITTHQSLPSPLFDLTYCDNSSFSLVQDPRREIVYSVPYGIYAQISPKCTMDSSTKTYATAESMAKEKSLEHNLQVDGGLSGSYSKISLSLSASYSQSDTTTTAEELQKRLEGSISVTELHCETSKIHLVEKKFHPKFIQDISTAFVDGDQVKSDKMMQNIIKKYGSLYYQSATLGGKLEITSVVSNSFTSRKSKNEVEKSIEASASVQFSASIFSASVSGSVSGSGSLDSSNSIEEQSDYETNSMRSTVKVYGGEPGSYGSSTDPNALNTWARSVDIVPYPISYKVGYISDIIPKSWFFKPGVSIQKAWERNELALYKQYFEKKVSKYIDHQSILANLKKEDTVYNIQFPDDDINISNPYNLEIVNLAINDPPFQFYNLAPIFTDSPLTSNIILNNYDDHKGIKSIKFSTPSGESIQPSPIFTLFNLFTSRAYEFVYNVALDLYETQPAKIPNTIIVQFTDFSVTPQLNDGKPKRVLLTVHGTTGKNVINLCLENESHGSLNIISYNGGPIQMESTENIGKIIGVDFSYLIDHKYLASEANIFEIYKITFKSLIVKRYCLHDSECIPKDTLESEGYINAYELWHPDGFTVKYTYGKPTWFPLNPLKS
ncbi:hypothetical protein CYY_003090 [Polysphondylium violaceum]|uniref:MACPF domain-containing protein n=1 Tax=Polysphondylium violaceum TaxID=133409 RepID=A0A8J4PZ19_9MYCE|nr:hypothetical protein CYY_003090 [Polysphondylium violaceum]